MKLNEKTTKKDQKRGFLHGPLADMLKIIFRNLKKLFNFYF